MKIALISDTHNGDYRLNPSTMEYFFKELVGRDPDIIIHAGDWASKCFNEMRDCVRLLRKYYSKPIISVMAGNHDCWESNMELTYVEERIELTKKLFKRYRIKTQLHIREEKLLITGFSGWYGGEPPSNDYYWIPHHVGKFGGLHDYMRGLLDREWVDAIDTIQNKKYEDWTKIAVTHFNITPFTGGRRYDAIIAGAMSGNFSKFQTLKDIGVKVICYGHTHSYDNTIVEGVQMLNSGSDYGSPRYLLFEVNDGSIHVNVISNY